MAKDEQKGTVDGDGEIGGGGASRGGILSTSFLQREKKRKRVTQL